MEQHETSVIFVDDDAYEAMHIFNANAFADGLKKEVNACVTRVTIFRHNARSVRTQVSNDLKNFEEKLNSQIGELTQSAINNPELSIVCHYDNTKYIADICSTLVFLKSFLDVYSRLVVKSLDPNVSVMFNKGKVDEDGESIAGGKLINWLRNSVSPSQDELSDIILKHSKGWINTAVRYRDTVVHYGDISELRRTRVPLLPESPVFSAENIEPPTMPHGEHVSDYVRDLASKLHEFLEETVPLVANVNLELIDFQKFPLDDS